MHIDLTPLRVTSRARHVGQILHIRQTQAFEGMGGRKLQPKCTEKKLASSEKWFCFVLGELEKHDEAYIPCTE